MAGPNPQPLKVWPAGSMAKSINANLPDFQTDIQLTTATYNVTSGLHEGIGPRYGFAPIPGQMDDEVPSATCPGLLRYDTVGLLSVESHSWLRVGANNLFAYRFRGANSGGIGSTATFYAYTVTYTTSLQSGTFYDVLLTSTIDGSGNTTQASDISAGLQYFGAAQILRDLNISCPSLTCEKLVIGASTVVTETIFATAQQTTMQNLLLASGTATPWTCAAPFTITGTDVEMAWIFGGKVGATPTSTLAPSLNLGAYFASTNTTAAAGIPASFNYGNFPLTARELTFYCLTNNDTASIAYTVTVTASTTVYAPMYVNSITTANVNMTGITALKSGSGSTYSSIDGALMNDPLLTTNSSYQGMLVATGGKPILILYQDAFRGTGGQMQQYVDLTTMPAPSVGGSSYTAGAANSGILSANTVYEFGVSIYDKRLNYETNVVPAGELTTSTNDQVSAIIYGPASDQTIAKAQLAAAVRTPLNFPNIGDTSSASTYPAHLNYLQYRFYYMQQGIGTWLPALFIDAAQYWYWPAYTSSQPLAMCTGAIGGSPGGMPGGFNDYSTLPQDNYTCTLMYKNRAFWFSDKAMIFSLINNVFAYPGRNSAACPEGSFKGALVQAYYGQAEQNARIVVFGTTGTYVGVFTGNPQLVPVQVSAGTPGFGPTIGQYPLDGSDFVLNAWTSVTAFSYRSAVVAEGLLYFWGPNGIFLDDGVDPIQRVSIPLEPDIFNFYDPSQTDAIFANYNDTTKEITWYFPPLGGDQAYPTHGFVYQTYKKTWLYVKFTGQIDAASTVAIDTDLPVSGTRQVIFARQAPITTVQRAYFCDQNNLAGDMRPETEFMVKAISTPSAGLRRLTLAAGYNATSFGQINVGDLFALQQCAAYTNGALTSPSDFIATIAAINHSGGTVDLLLPSGATLDASATIAANNQFFPIWHATPTAPGLNGIPYVLDTKFWIPGGMTYWAYWLYLHMVFELYDLIPGPAPAISLTYQTPISNGMTQTDTLTLTNNSLNNCQIFHSMKPGPSSNFEGQGMKLTFSGVQLANFWVLQFIEAYAQLKDGLQLKLFEG